MPYEERSDKSSSHGLVEEGSYLSDQRVSRKERCGGVSKTFLEKEGRYIFPTKFWRVFSFNVSLPLSERIRDDYLGISFSSFFWCTPPRLTKFLTRHVESSRRRNSRSFWSGTSCSICLLQTWRTMLLQFSDPMFLWGRPSDEFMGGEQEYTRKSMTLSRLFYVKRFKKIMNVFEVTKGVWHRSNKS